MDEGISFFFCKLNGMRTCLVIIISIENDFCAVLLGMVDFDQRSCCRHNDHCLTAIFFCRICHTLSMISCRCSNQSLLSVLIRQSADLIVSTSDLECAGLLHILWFEIYFVAALVAEALAVYQAGLVGHTADNLTCFFKFFQSHCCHHGFCVSFVVCCVLRYMLVLGTW